MRGFLHMLQLCFFSSLRYVYLVDFNDWCGYCVPYFHQEVMGFFRRGFRTVSSSSGNGDLRRV